jgi:ATP-binding cassette, subfamily F, member 3
MAANLQVTNLGKSHSTLLFEGVNLGAGTPSRIGLIGDNGSGKSTFLKMLGGLESLDQGTVFWSKDSKVGYLEQEIQTDTFDVSGGEKKILRLTELFYGDYNVILLDEPDNHLDLDHKLWFEELVRNFEGILIIISHDRKLLSNAIEKIWLLEEKHIAEYPFNYEKFKDIYSGRMSARGHLWEVQEKERLRLEDIVRRFKDKAASDSKLSGRYHGAIKRYEKFVGNMVEKPPEEKKIDLTTKVGKQHTKKIAIQLKNLNKNYGSISVLKNTNLLIKCGEKIAIQAPNGSGKSTLLNIIGQKLAFDSGEVMIGPGLDLGFYTQEHLEALHPQASLIEEIQKNTPLSWYDAIAYLKKFLFTEDQSKMQVKWLSGGQRSRLQLAKFLGTNPDILILDEPTNHLDLKTVLALENFLKEYKGTLILVSHDQELVKSTTDKICLLSEGSLEINSE